MASMVTIAKTVSTGTIAIMVTMSRMVATSKMANVLNGYNGHNKFFVPRTGIIAFDQGSTLLVAVVISTGLLLPRVFRWITAPLTSMLKTTGLSNLAPKELGTDEIVGGSGRADETVVDLSKSSKSQRIVKKSNNLKGLKSYKGHRFEGTRLSTSTSSFWSRSPTRRRLLADQRLSGSGGGGARGVSSRSTKESH